MSHQSLQNPPPTYDDVCLPSYPYLHAFVSHDDKADVAARDARCSVIKATPPGAPRGTSYLDSITNHIHARDGDREELSILHHDLRRDAFEVMHLQTGTSIRLLEQHAVACQGERDQLLTLFPVSYRKETGDLAATGQYVTAYVEEELDLRWLTNIQAVLTAATP